MGFFFFKFFFCCVPYVQLQNVRILQFLFYYFHLFFFPLCWLSIFTQACELCDIIGNVHCSVSSARPHVRQEFKPDIQLYILRHR